LACRTLGAGRRLAVERVVPVALPGVDDLSSPLVSMFVEREL